MENNDSDEIFFAPDKQKETASERPWILLVVDDESDVHHITHMALKSLALEGRPLEIVSGYSGEKAIEILRQHDDIALILLDIVMETDDAGLKVVRSIREELKNSLVRIILRTGQPGVAPEREVIHDYDIIGYIEKADLTAGKLYSVVLTGLKSYRDLNRLAELSCKLEEANRCLVRENIHLKKEVYSHFRPESIIGNSPKWMESIKLAEYTGGSDSNVLLMGETGTGKELIARFIHYNGILKDKSFIAVNCASFSTGLLDSELFGHVKGAFTGAISDRIGIFEEANGGTLFLDEIGDMSLEVQAKVLRAIQFGEIKRVGENKTRKTRVRIIAATNKDIQKEINENRFREDLFYRLAVFTIPLPPLRERREDIPLLVNAFLKRYAKGLKRESITIRPEVIEALAKETFAGNVRELENKIERMANIVPSGNAIDMNIYNISDVCGKIGPITSNESDTGTVSLPLHFGENFDLKKTVQGFEKQIIMKAIDLCKGNKAAAAKLLKMPERTFFTKLSQ